MNAQKIMRSRYGGVVLFGILFLILAFITRTVLLFIDLSSEELTLFRLVEIYAIGLFYDLIALSYFIIPFTLYLLVVPNNVYRSVYHRWIAYPFFILSIGILIFSCTGEYFFWKEFSVRYNFIAVDYLVYTHEVIGNIEESYPIPMIIMGMLLMSAAIFAIIYKPFNRTQIENTKFKKRLVVTLGLWCIPALAFFTVNSRTVQIKANTYCNELAHNGIYQIFAAFRNNELNYKTFYRSIDDRKAFSHLRQLLITPNSHFTSNNVFDITRKVEYPGRPKRYNVILITVESLSADFFTRFGNTDHITPHMDKLLPRSLLFTNFFATGTRTVRGMEALTLSLPPTPGSSIVKRPHNEDMSTLGNILRKKGYECNFIYAGYGYFDNMNYFFSHNGYNIIDENNFSKSEITFKTIWGVCDEDLFAKTIKVADQSYAKGKLFHDFIMTTSNHRPYEYPSGRIDIPSHSGRKGAVKYTDYAIVKFLHDAVTHPWFKNTIFLIVADHCASSAGKTSLPVAKYHIPLIIYAPDIVRPGENNSLCSQVDVSPTIMGLLNMSYTSKFYGKDVLLEDPDRVFLSTYQKIGFLHDNKLIVQEPTMNTESFKVTGLNQEASTVDKNNLFDCITYYQTASYLFHHGALLFKK